MLLVNEESCIKVAYTSSCMLLSSSTYTGQHVACFRNNMFLATCFQKLSSVWGGGLYSLEINV